MKHDDIRHMLSEYIDGEVTAAEKAEIEKHLRTCAECSNALAELQKTIQQVKNNIDEMDPPAWMTQKIMARVRAEAEEKKGIFRKLFFPLHVKLPIEAVAVAFLTITAYYITQSVRPEMKVARAPAEAPSPVISENKPSSPIIAKGGASMQSQKLKAEAPVLSGKEAKPAPAPAAPAGGPLPESAPELKADQFAAESKAPAAERLRSLKAQEAPAPAKKREAAPFPGFIAKDEARNESAAKLYQGTWKFTGEEEKLIITHSDGRLRGVYYGLELGGEHGRFYYVTEVVNLKIDTEGNISFDIPERELITEPARTLAEAMKMAKSEDRNAGFSRDIIHMKGSMKNGYLELECRSDSDSCYDRTMKFKRMD